MKKVNNIFILSLFAISVAMSSCSKSALDKVNYDKNDATDVSAKFILTDAMTSTAFNVVGGDASLYSSVYMEHEAGDYEQMYNAETRTTDPTASTTYNNLWGAIYGNIANLKIAVTKTSAGGEEAGNDVTCGIAKILLAYNLGVLTDLYGDVPYSETGIDANNAIISLQPTIDKQQALYTDITNMLDSAITLLGGSDAAATGGIGSQDLIYAGSANAWIKAAYGLKARYLMHTLKVSSDVTGDLNKIITYAKASFTSADDELKFAQYDGASAYNPLDAFNESRVGDLGVSQSLATKFSNLSDPRGNVAFGTWAGKVLSVASAVAKGIPNGNPNQGQEIYPLSIIDFAYTAPTELLSYHEVQFLEAEAYARLGGQANLDNALAALKLAVEDAFTDLNSDINVATPYFGFDAGAGLSADDANNYFTTYVTPRFKTNPVQEVMLQKYLAFYGARGESLEAYNDYRRLLALGQSSYVELANPLNSSKFPLRFAYGSSDVTTNKNVEAAYKAISVYQNAVWWAGGSN